MSIRVRAGRLAGAAAVAAMMLSACTATVDSPQGSGAPADGGDVLNLVGYAVPKAGNNAVQKLWAETDEGAGVSWVESYGASGDQSRAVEAGLKADYVHFSLEGDVTRLVKAGLVDESWKDGPTGGIVTSSLVVIAVREGNPKNIQGWDDLIKDDVTIVTPNPGSSGAARWNILAAWAHAQEKGGSEQAAIDFTTKLFNNIVALPGSGRDATSAFLAGTGDVLLSYENETILARQNGEKLDYIVPDVTLRIDNPGAVLKDANPKAKAWLDFVLTQQAQAEFVKLGFRPVIDGVEIGEVEGVNDPSNPFPTPGTLVTINDYFGGWDAANPKFFDEENGIITKIQVETGKSS